MEENTAISVVLPVSIGLEVPTTMNYGPQLTPAQSARAERSLAILRPHEVPHADEPLWVPDDQDASLRSADEVARRTLVLLAVVQRAEAAPRDIMLKRVKKAGAWEIASDAERALLECEFPEDAVARRLVWRLEAVSVLMWALTHVSELVWPSELCDVDRLAKLLDERQGVPDLVGTARLRPTAEILDALDLTLRVSRAVDDAWQSNLPIPANLDWAEPTAMLRPTECRAVNIVRQRELALRWIAGFGEVAWDVPPG